jgi:hypothetical protein
MKLVTGHEKLVTGHHKKSNFLKTGHKTNWSRLVMAGHDQTGHKSHKTQFLGLKIWSLDRYKYPHKYFFEFFSSISLGLSSGT